MFHTAGADPSRLMDKTDRECKIELQSEPKSKPSAPRLSLQIKAQRSGFDLWTKTGITDMELWRLLRKPTKRNGANLV